MTLQLLVYVSTFYSNMIIVSQIIIRSYCQSDHNTLSAWFTYLHIFIELIFSEPRSDTFEIGHMIRYLFYGFHLFIQEVIQEVTHLQQLTKDSLVMSNLLDIV